MNVENSQTRKNGLTDAKYGDIFACMDHLATDTSANAARSLRTAQ
jgi:hypothetical protein